MSSDSDSGYEEEDGAMTFVLHNAAEVGDAAALERMLGLAEEAGVPLAIGAVFRRLVNLGDTNECTPLHLAIINGHAACVRPLLRAGASATKVCDGNPPLALAACLGLSGDPERAAAAEPCVSALLKAGADPHDKDDGGRTALHWAATAGRPECCSLLLAAATATHRSKLAALAADMSMLALGGVGGAMPALERPEHILATADHDGLTALHLAAKFGHAAVVSLLLTAAAESGDAAAAAAAEEAAKQAAEAVAKAARAAAAAVAAAEAAAAAAVTAATALAADGAVAPMVAEAPKPAAAVAPPPPLSAAQLAALLPVSDPAALLKIKTKQDGHTPLHMAAIAGRGGAVAALLAAAGPGGGAVKSAAAVADKKGRAAAELARRRGHVALAAALDAAAAGQPFLAPPAEAPVGPTALLAPEDCLLHRTAPEPITRSGSEPPPENVNRLHVLTRPVSGILYNSEFSDLQWRTSGVPQAAMVDVLKCHEWSYVRGVIQACEAIADSPSVVGSLDADTAISRGTWRAAMAAAGAVCAAVDDVMAGKARNAFCAVRPPGHHAGPTGVVTNPNDPHGSHGFCLLSNVAIGAAYAMSMYRGQGVRRVAILDFDVHHGNGTQACVINTAPTVRTVPIRTPYSEGAQRFPCYKPWLGDGDVHNIFFASVQGFGRRGGVGWFYPGSGATADSAIAEALAPIAAAAAAAATAAADLLAAASPAPAAGERASGAAEPSGTPAAAAPVSAAAATPGPSAPAAAAAPLDAVTSATPAPAPTAASTAAVPSAAGSGNAGGESGVAEDPDEEFKGSYDVTVVGGPRVINVGIPGPGGKPRMWRRAWRDKILPALMNFNPDLIIVSAGFDAHKKEDLNLRYVGVTEADYEWLTGQIVEVANACCGGRVVSVLEGGYNLRGGALGSAFARSVAAHVRSLAAPCSAPYDPAEAEAERAAEKAIEARKAAKVAALAAGLTAAHLATPRSAAPTPRGFPLPSAAAAAAAAHATATGDESTPAATAASAIAGGGSGVAPMDMDAPSTAPPPLASAGGAAGADGGGGDEPASKRRRRPPVDYAALNAQLEKEKQEAAALAAGGGAAGGGGSAGAS